MRRSLLVLLALASLSVVLVACGGSDDTDTGDGGIPVYADAGTEIQVTSGERFAIELPANPSTGYAWQVELPAGLTQDSDEIIPPVGQTDDEAVGVPGMQRWEFTVDEAQNGVLVFANVPPGADEAEQTIEFDLVAD